MRPDAPADNRAPSKSKAKRRANAAADGKSKLPDVDAARQPPSSQSTHTSSRRASSKRRRASQAQKEDETAPPATSQQRERWTRLFEELDTSGDALIDKQEFLAATTLWAEACPRIISDELDFMAWDADGNGYLCEGEFICFCDALLQIIGEREFGSLEAQLRREKEGALAVLPSLEAPGAPESDPPPREEPAPERNPQLPPLPPEPEPPREAAAESTTRQSGSGRRSRASGVATARKPGGNWAPLADQAAEKLREAMVEKCGKDSRKALRKSINEARLAGVDRELLDEAVNLVRKIEVEEVLHRAMASKKPQLLRVAILNVRKMDADEEMIEEAEKLLSFLEVRESIKAAITKKDCEGLQAVVVKAEEIGMDSAEIAETQQTLKIMRQRDALDDALATKDLAKLNKQIMHMRAILNNESLRALVDPMLKEALEALPQLEGYGEARNAFFKALTTGSTQDIKFCIDEARAAGISEEDISRGQRILRKEEAREALVTAISSERRNLLLEAIESATQADIKLPELETARRLVKRLDIARDMCQAMDNADLSALRNVVAEAKLQGLDDVKTQKAEQMIARLDSAGFG